MKVSRHILPVIVVSQFCCTSLWFAGNGVMDDLVANFGLQASALGHLTSAVQLGFISGTLVFALLNIADRFSPSIVFLVCAFAGAVINAGMIWEGNSFPSLIAFRFFTGFFLAGIYPVGMKIAADYYERGLGKSLGYLVGALVLGTAFPHFLKGFSGDLPWKMVLLVTSSLAVLGGLLMYLLVPDGPHRKPGQRLDPSAVWKVFQNRQFRAAAVGYFGHMWELYAFWAFVTVMLGTFNSLHAGADLDVSLWSFLIIGLGGPACVLGGYLSLSLGSGRVATLALLVSCLCCLFSPLVFFTGSSTTLLAFLLFWGMVVIADSPLFSTLVAQNAQPEIKGTALTIVNSIGFFITIFSIQLLTFLQQVMDSRFIYLFLALGPILGLWALRQGQPTGDAPHPPAV